MVLDETGRALIALIQDGLPLAPRPYAAIAAALGIGEREVIARLTALLDRGMIKRLGVVVRHRELGYRANAMVVWDVSDESVDETGRRLGEFDCVTLCYRRPRRLPLWPYNLFCMIHGKDRDSVQARLAEIIRAAGLEGMPYQVLFSKRRFKQRGARYVDGGAGVQAQRKTANG